LAHDFTIKVALEHLGARPAERPRDVLQQERDLPELTPRPGDVVDDDVDGGARVRRRGQVSNLAPTGAHERNVLGDDRGAEIACETCERARAIHVDSFRSGERELHAMRNDWPDLPECERFAARAILNEARLGHHLHEVDRVGSPEQIGRDLRS
jgi:hypothetical protein